MPSCRGSSAGRREELLEVATRGGRHVGVLAAGLGRDLVALLEGFAAELARDADRLRERVVGTCERVTSWPREISRCRDEDLIHPRAHVDLEVGDGRRLELSDEAERLLRRLIREVDAVGSAPAIRRAA